MARGRKQYRFGTKAVKVLSHMVIDVEKYASEDSVV